MGRPAGRQLKTVLIDFVKLFVDYWKLVSEDFSFNMFNEWRVGPARAGALRFEGASACGERVKRTGQTKGARAQGLGLRTEGVRLSLPPHLRGMSGDIA